MVDKRTHQGPISPESPDWVRYYEAAAKRRGGHGDMDHRRLRELRHRRKQMQRVWIVASLVGIALLAWLFNAVLSR